MTDRASLADAIDPRGKVFGDVWPPSVADLIAASDSIRTPPPNHAALVQVLLATCDRLGMTNRPADAPAAFARVLDAAQFSECAPSSVLTELLDICKRQQEELRLIRIKDCGAVYDTMIRIDAGMLLFRLIGTGQGAE